MIVENTNIYIRKITQNMVYNYKKRETDLTEIKAVIGILYLAGVLHGNRMNLSEYWTTDSTGNDIFPAVMGINQKPEKMQGNSLECRLSKKLLLRLRKIRGNTASFARTEKVVIFANHVIFAFVWNILTLFVLIV